MLLTVRFIHVGPVAPWTEVGGGGGCGRGVVVCVCGSVGGESSLGYDAMVSFCCVSIF